MGWQRGRNPRDAHRIASRDGLRCHYCGRVLTLNRTQGRRFKNFATFDHVIPRSKGGSVHDINNIVLACKPCNNMRGDMDYGEFIKKFSQMMNTINPNKRLPKGDKI